MTDAFDKAREVSALDVAQREGLPLHRRGARWWAACPLHGEKTPSMCFYPDGRWYCFGCHEGGDAVTLYAALHGATAVEAAQALAGGGMPRRQLPRRPKPKPFLAGADEDGYTWDRLCAIRSAADEIIAAEEDTPRLWQALAARSMAEERLDNMMLSEEGRKS